MKKWNVVSCRIRIILPILIGIIIASATVSFASETTRWVLIARSAGSKDFYIDSSSLKYQLLKMKLKLKEEQIALAWFKIVPNKGSKRTDSLVEKYINEEVGYSTALIQTNCSNSTLRVLIINIYDKNNKIAHRSETLTSKFEGIPSSCVFEDIKDIICN